MRRNEGKFSQNYLNRLTRDWLVAVRFSRSHGEELTLSRFNCMAILLSFGWKVASFTSLAILSSLSLAACSTMAYQTRKVG
jgi:hypothetical protein